MKDSSTLLKYYLQFYIWMDNYYIHENCLLSSCQWFCSIFPSWLPNINQANPLSSMLWTQMFVYDKSIPKWHNSFRHAEVPHFTTSLYCGHGSWYPEGPVMWSLCSVLPIYHSGAIFTCTCIHVEGTAHAHYAHQQPPVKDVHVCMCMKCTLS